MGKIGELLGLPLGYVMYWIYGFVNNYGVAIILFTLLTRLIMLPFSYKQQLGNVRQQALNPKINKLRKQYANNPQRLQEEQQKLYAEEGINPMAGCVTLIPTMIILYGVIDVVYRPLTHILRISSDAISKAKAILETHSELIDKSFKTRPELTILRNVKEHPDLFKDLGNDVIEKVSNFNNTFMGVDFSMQPSLKPETWNSTAIALVMIPILSGVVQLLFTIYSQYRTKKMNPDAGNMQGAGCANVMLYGMTAFSVWLAFTVPAGVGFYWIWSTVFSFLITFLLYMYFTPKRVEAINAKIKEKNKNKKPGFMQRMMEQQNELMKAQGGGSRPDYNADTDGMSRAEKQNYNRQLINEARKRMAEKYGDEYKDDDEEK